MATKKKPEAEGGIGNVSARRRDVLKLIAASAVVYSTPVMSSFNMEGLRFDQAYAFGSNQTVLYGSNQSFLYKVVSWFHSKIGSWFGWSEPL